MLLSRPHRWVEILFKSGNIGSRSKFYRQYHSQQTNTIVNFVPQQEAWVIERMGKYYKILEPGLNILIPVVDRIKYVQILKEIPIEIPQQGAITIDNVQLQLDGVLYIKITDPYKASYGIDEPEFAVTQLAQTTMRSEVGKISLDTVFKEREQLNAAIVEAINKAAEPWGLVCLRYEIRNMTMPERIQEAMQMQVEAERKKRAAVLESEGKKYAAVNVAEGEKQARILASEAIMQEQINSAMGVAKAIELEADARRNALEKITEALNKVGGNNAAALLIAEKYVKAFQNMAKENNTLILNNDVSSVSSMVSQALTIYKKLSSQPNSSSVNISSKLHDS